MAENEVLDNEEKYMFEELKVQIKIFLSSLKFAVCNLFGCFKIKDEIINMFFKIIDKNPSLVDFLLENTDIIKSKDLTYFLTKSAILGNNRELVEKLINQLNFKDCNSEDMSMLNIAFKDNCNPEIIKLLINNEKININIKDDNGKNPILESVIKSNNKEIIKAVLRRKDLKISQRYLGNILSMNDLDFEIKEIIENFENNASEINLLIKNDFGVGKIKEFLKNNNENINLNVKNSLELIIKNDLINALVEEEYIQINYLKKNSENPYNLSNILDNYLIKNKSVILKIQITENNNDKSIFTIDIKKDEESKEYITSAEAFVEMSIKNREDTILLLDYINDYFIDKKDKYMSLAIENFLKSNREQNISNSFMLDLAIENNKNVAARFLINHLSIEDLKAVKEENKIHLMEHLCLVKSNELFLEFYNNQEFFGNIFDNNYISYFNLLNCAYSMENYQLIEVLEEKLEEKMDEVEDKNLPLLLKVIRISNNPSSKVFNLLLKKVKKADIDKYLIPIENINEKKQGERHIYARREFKKNKNGSIEIMDFAYAKIKNKNNDSEIISKNKLYETIYNQDRTKKIIHYRANEEKILFTENIENNEIVDFNFNRDGLEKLNENKFLNYFSNEVTKIYNINYQDVEGFDNVIPHSSYALLYLEEYFENDELNTEKNVSFRLDFANNSLLDNEENTKGIENISEKIIDSLNEKNKDKMFVFNFSYNISDEYEANGKGGGHNVQIVVSNGEAIKVNTGGCKEYDKILINNINEKIKEKFRLKFNKECEYNPLMGLESVEQIGGICNLASKIYLNQLAIEYRKKFGNLSKMVERLNNFKRVLNETVNLDIDIILKMHFSRKKEDEKKIEEENNRILMEYKSKNLDNDFLRTKEVIEETNKNLKEKYKNFFKISEDFHDFAIRYNRLQKYIEAIEELNNKKERSCNIF